MTIKNTQKEQAVELSNFLSSELREMGFSIGNLELHDLSKLVLKKFGLPLYKKGISDSQKLHEKLMERLEEDLYILAQSDDL